MPKATPLFIAVVLSSLAGACKQSNPAFDEPGGSGSSSSSVGVTTVAATTGSASSTGTTRTSSSSTAPAETTSGPDPETSGTTMDSEETTTTGSSSSSSTGDTDGCAAPSLVCGGVCVDVTSDAMHCGKCDNSCPGNQVCTKSDCGPG